MTCSHLTEIASSANRKPSKRKLFGPYDDEYHCYVAAVYMHNYRHDWINRHYFDYRYDDYDYPLPQADSWAALGVEADEDREGGHRGLPGPDNSRTAA